MSKPMVIGTSSGDFRDFDADLFIRMIDDPAQVKNNQKQQNALAALENVIIFDLFDNPRDETRLRVITYLEQKIRQAKKDDPSKPGKDVLREFYSLEKILLGLKELKVFQRVWMTDDAQIKALMSDVRAATGTAPEGSLIEIDAERFVTNVQQDIKNRTPQEIQEMLQMPDAVKKADALPTTIYPDTFTMSLANAVTNLASVTAPVTKDIKRESTHFPVGKDATVYVQLGINVETALDSGITIPKGIDDFDLEVLNAIVSLLKAGNRIFWPAQIASVLKGKKAADTNTHETEIERIKKSVERLRFTAVYIDATEQFRNLKYPVDPNREVLQDDGIKHVVYDDNILHLRGARLVNLQNGKSVTAWEYISKEMPVLYDYSQQLKQVTSLDIRLLDTGTRSDETQTVAKTYMLREITKMRKGSRNNTKMLFSTIFRACGIDKPENDSRQAKNTNFNRKKRLKTYIAKFCEAWKKQGFITGYTMLPDGIKIDVPREKEAD